MKYSSLIIGLLSPSLWAAQIVGPENSTRLVVNQGDAITVSPYYNVSSPQTSNGETGLGLRVHFNSSALSFVQVSNALSRTIYLPDNSTLTDLQPIGAPQSDTQNLDGDSNTDQYFIISWVDPNGQWIDQPLPNWLFDVQFNASNTFVGETQIRFTASSTSAAAGSPAAFIGNPITICIDNGTVCNNTVTPGDADGDGDVDFADVLNIYNQVLNGNGVPYSNADYDQDGDVDFADVLATYNAVLNP